MRFVSEVSKGVLVSLGLGGIVEFRAGAVGVDVKDILIFVELSLLESELNTSGLGCAIRPGGG